MGNFRHWLIVAVALVATQPARPEVAAQQAAGSVTALEQGFNTPPDDSRIMMRWWWFGPSVTREQIEDEMRRMKEGGIGGFEIATVYPMAVDDPARGIRNYRYLSPEYLDLIGFTARKARELGMRMDVTLGSNTAINMLAEGGRVPDVRPLNEQFGQRFRLQDMDVFVPLPSGVMSVPRVILETTN